MADTSNTAFNADKFSTDSVPKEYQAIVTQFQSFAQQVWDKLPACADREVALRHIVDAKDHAVKAAAEGDSQKAAAQAAKDAEARAKEPSTAGYGTTTSRDVSPSSVTTPNMPAAKK